MAGRDDIRGRDPDDWFVDPGPAAATPERSGGASPAETSRAPAVDAGESRLGDDPVRRGRNASVLELASERWVVILAGLLLLGFLLLGGLVIGGAFSGSKHRAATPTPASSSRSTTRAATTTSTRSTTTVTPTVTPPTTTLKPGDQGSEVTALQKGLASLGDLVGAIDGNYGPATQRAVARFQAGAHLTADGIFGPATLAALARALQGP